MIIRSREFLDASGVPPLEMLSSVIAEHMNGLPRLEKLKAYYMARNDIRNRQRASGMPNNRISHAFARYITTVTAGYLVGKPVSYSAATESATLDAIQDNFKRNSIAAVDSENARNASIYGKGVEFVYVNTAAVPKVSAISPMNAFVVYDDTHEMQPMFGVYYTNKTKANGVADGYRIWLMTDHEILEYESGTPAAGNFTETKRTRHFFGGVPLVEYWNDENECGDFEWVISQIDAYDALASDRVNDKQQFVDRLLVLYGCTLEKDERGREPWQQLREDKALCLPDTDTKAEYLGDMMDETSNEILRNNIAEDIHKLSMVPDLSDKNFAANASGVAMKYKLFGLEQLTKIKEQWFREGLKSRLQLFINYFGVTGKQALDVADVKIEFTRAMPANLLELAQTVQAADSAMSIETKVKTLHDGEEWSQEDVDKEVQAINRTSEQMFNRKLELYQNKAYGLAELRSDVTGEEPEEAQAAIDKIKTDGGTDAGNSAMDRLLAGIGTGSEE